MTKEQNDLELLAVLKRLVMAASCRENTMGDPIHLIEAQAELRAATVAGRVALAKARGE